MISLRGGNFSSDCELEAASAAYEGDLVIPLIFLIFFSLLALAFI